MTESFFTAARGSALQTGSIAVPRDPLIEPEDSAAIARLVSVWRDHYPRNLIRMGFYMAHNGLKDFGISIPRSIATRVTSCIGWPAKAVRSLADLSVFDGVNTGLDDAYGVSGLAAQLEDTLAVDEAIVSAYIYGCSFITLTADDSDNPIFTPRSAELSAATWDGAHNRLSGALTITDATNDGEITGYSVFLPYRSYELVKQGNRWVVGRMDTNWPSPTVVPFVSDPQLSRPLGCSRITPVVMSATDSAFRTMVRMEASAEFYSVPKLWFLGADRAAFDENTWNNLISAINGIGADEETGEKPTMQQVQQASMDPHSTMLKTIAMLVASDTDLPVDSLGITLTNPTSAEAMAAAERRLTRRADRQNRLFGARIEELLRMAVCLRDGLTAPPADLDVKTQWMPTREISDAARADAYVKVAGVNPVYATSAVGLRRLGLTGAEIEALKADMNKRAGSDLLAALVAKGTSDGDSGDNAQ